MGSASYVISNVISSVAGLVLGFLLGRIANRVEKVRSVSIEETEQQPPRWWNNHTMSIVIAVLAALSVLLNTLLGIQVRDQAKCQRNYNTAVVTTITVRQQFADADRTALDDLVHDTATSKSAVDVGAALAKYQATRKVTDAARKANKFPEPPNC